MKVFSEKIKVIGALLLCVFIMTGCENKELTEKVNTGMKLVESYNYEEARNLFDEIIAQKQRKDAYRGQGLSNIGLGEYEEAILSFQNALASSTGEIENMDYDINYYLATAYYKNKDYDKARDVYTAILELKTKEAEALFLRGKCYLALSDIESALDDFDRYIAIDSKNIAHYISIYESMEAFDYGEEGTIYLNKALSEISNLTTEEIGTIYYYLGEYEKAKEYIEDGDNKRTKETALILGKTYEALGAQSYAASVYLNYLETDEGCAEIYNQLAICKFNEENYEEALMYLQEGFAYADVELLQMMKFNEVVIYEFSGEFTKAKTAMNEYLSNYPADSEAINEYEFLKSR